MCERGNGPVSPNFERLLLYPFEGQIVDLDILGMITEQYCNNMRGEGGEVIICSGMEIVAVCRSLD